MKCETCGSELPPAPKDENAVWECPYCGRQPGWRPTPKKGLKFWSQTLPALIFAIVVIGIIGAADVYWHRRQHRQAYTLDDIAKAPVGKWVGVRRTGMVGSLKALDPVGNFPWAQAYARAWASDAVLERLSVSHVGRNGAFPDVHSARYSRGYKVWYVFFSPSRLSEAKELAKTSEKAAATSLVVNISDGRTLVMLQTSKYFDPTTPRPVVSCSLADVMKAAQEPPHAARERPFYDIDLRYRSAQWAWQVDNKTFVNAETCKQLP